MIEVYRVYSDWLYMIVTLYTRNDIGKGKGFTLWRATMTKREV